MADEPHDVVKLLVARMESNPEEFNDDDGRWAQWLDELLPFVTEEERVMLRKPMMQTIHEEVLDELLNGPDKRREAEENRKEYERHLAQTLQHTQRQAMQQGIPLGGGGGGFASLPVGLSPYSSGGGGIVGKSYTSAIMDSYDSDLDKYQNTPTGSITSAIKPKPSPYDKIMNALKRGK